MHELNWELQPTLGESTDTNKCWVPLPVLAGKLGEKVKVGKLPEVQTSNMEG